MLERPRQDTSYVYTPVPMVVGELNGVNGNSHCPYYRNP